MGYLTTYSLDVINQTDDIDHITQVSQQSAYECDDIFQDSLKWYDHEDDMKKYSKQYPDLIFKLLGEGEESGDIWIKYFKNGKMQRCDAKIIFDEYNESLLK